MTKYSAEIIFETLQWVLTGERVLIIARTLNISEAAINLWKKKFSGLSKEEIEVHIRIQKETNSKHLKEVRSQVKMYPGYKFKRLIAIKEDINRKYHWIFKCTCGTEKSIRTSMVTGHYTSSCGCLARETKQLFKLTPKEYLKELNYNGKKKLYF